jgi:hypothetical protein
MRSSLVKGAVARRDHEALSRIIQSCAVDGRVGGLGIAVCNELGIIYLTIETGCDEEFIDVMACLAQLGFADVALVNSPHDAVLRRAD